MCLKVHSGRRIGTAKRILENIKISLFGVFKDTEFTRMADLHFILLIMSTIETGGYFNQDKEVEPCVEGFNDEYPNAERTYNRIIQALRIIEELALPYDSMWFRKSNFFTLVSQVAFTPEQIPVDFREKLILLEGKVMENKNQPDNEFGKYYSYMYQGTNSRKARVVRADLLRRDCF